MPRSATNIRHLRESSARIMVPTPVLTEYLLGFDVDEQEEQQRALEENFFVADLNAHAAAIAARIGRSDVVKDEIKRRRRPSVRTDVQIIAIAVAHTADSIVTNNVNEFRKLAQGAISISDIPSFEEQQRLIE